MGGALSDMCGRRTPPSSMVKSPGNNRGIPSRYEVGRKLGSGSHGTVREAYDTEKETKVAIKQMRNIFDDNTDCRRILREIAILTQLSHPNVVRVHDIIVPPDIDSFVDLCLVLEKCDMALNKYIRMDVTLELWQVNTLFSHLLLGLHYVHACGIIHRDLKPANCLFNAAVGELKICDFGLARSVHSEQFHVQPLPESPLTEGDEGSAKNLKNRIMTQHVVTRWYRAPELAITPGEYTPAIDVWSSGCIYAELLQMLKDGEEAMDREPLFPGSSCYPLSPAKAGRAKASGSRTRGQSDQLEVIFNVIGTPSEEDIVRCFASEEARTYLRDFDSREGQGIGGRFKYVDKDSLSLLKGMLCFDILERLDCVAALQHRTILAVMDKDEIDAAAAAPKKVRLAFEAEADLNELRLRHYFGEEFRKFHTAAAA